MKRRRFICLLMLPLLTGCAPAVPVHSLWPEYPKARLGAFSEVDSVQPTLRWRSFPGSEDRKADHEGLLARIRNVTYDLKVFRAERDYPGQVIYARSGLPEPSHRLETPLEPSANYFWTVRARFELDGVTRVTPWGRMVGGADLVVPSPYYYKLKAPSK